MTAVTDDMLIAYIDGGLSDEETAVVEAAVAADPEVAERLRRHRAVRAMINEALAGAGQVAAGRAGSGKGDAAVVSLDAARRTREAPSRVKAKAAAASQPRKPRKPLDPRVGALVVGALAGLAGGLMLPRPATGPVDSSLRARGALSSALESGLASEQKPGAEVRLGVTFRDRADHWCRSFTTEVGLTGIACRDRKGWQVVVAETGLRTAASTSPGIQAAIEAMIDGKPVDAAGERKARADGWR